MKFRDILGVSFGMVAGVSAITAASLYLPEIANKNEFYGIQIVNNDNIYRNLKNNVNSVNVFNDNQNIYTVNNATPNVSFETLLDGTNEYANGNYVVLFATDADPKSNLFLYGDEYKENNQINYNKFGFKLETNKKGKLFPSFDKTNVKVHFAHGQLQNTFQYLTTNSNRVMMSALPSIVLIHDRINFDVMKSFVKYVEYVKKCFNDVEVKLNGSYTFKPNTKNFNQLKKNSPEKLDFDKSLDLFYELTNYDPSDDKQENKYNLKAKEEAENLNKEYEWASELAKNNGTANYGFDFNPIDSEFNVKTYVDPYGESKPYRDDVSATNYYKIINKFKNKFTPTYINNSFENSNKNTGHYLGFIHTSISESTEVLNVEMTTNSNTNLNSFAGQSSKSLFSASLINKFNSITNSKFNGVTLPYVNNVQKPKVWTNTDSNKNKQRLISTFYISK